MQILVTGGTGYIGSHTSIELLQAGYEVVIIDNLSNSYESILGKIEQIAGKPPQFFNIDLKDKEAVKQFFATQPQPDAIVHFAAYKAVGESFENPLLYYENNMLALMHLLEYMPQKTDNNLVFSSSCTVYGQPDELPVSENSPLKPAMSPYGNTKKIAEDMLQDYIRAHHNLNAISLRYFNPVGAHPSGLIGELPQGKPNNLMPFITQTALGLHDELKVFGKDYNTPDGTCIRDYINVVDLAKAHICALNRLLKKENGDTYEVFNLGTGKGVSVLEMIQSFERVSGLKLAYKFAPRRPGDVETVYADPTKANKELNWSSQISLDETIRSAWKWEQNYRNKEKRNKKK